VDRRRKLRTILRLRLRRTVSHRPWCTPETRHEKISLRSIRWLNLTMTITLKLLSIRARSLSWKHLRPHTIRNQTVISSVLKCQSLNNQVRSLRAGLKGQVKDAPWCKIFRNRNWRINNRWGCLGKERRTLPIEIAILISMKLWLNAVTQTWSRSKIRLLVIRTWSRAAQSPWNWVQTRLPDAVPR
jgi:hypothetical protein